MLTKRQCIKKIQAKGYTEQTGEGASGDCGWGSRLYFKKPGARLNEFGHPLEHATASKVPGRGWLPSYFGGK